MLGGLFDFLRKSPSKGTSAAQNRRIIPARGWTRNYTSVSDEDGTMAIATAYRCVRVIAETVAQMSGDVIKSKNGSQREKKNDHNQYKLLFKKPDTHTNSFVFRRQLIYNYLISGNGYAIIHRDGNHRPYRYELVGDMEIYESEDRQFRFYHHRETDTMYDADDIIHLADLGIDELKGKSRITQHKMTFGKSKATSDLVNALYTNKMFMGAAVEYPENIKFADGYPQTTADAISSNYGGVDEAGNVIVLDQGGKLKQFENVMSLHDAEYIMGAHLDIEDICRIFGVPPFKVFHFNKMTYDNMEAMKVDFVESCILPIITQLEQEINLKCFSGTEIREGYYVKYNVKSLLRADRKAEAEYIKAMFSVGKYTINEIRSMDDLSPVKGGDSVFVQVNNYMPLDRLKEYVDAQIDSKKNKVTRFPPATEEEE